VVKDGEIEMEIDDEKRILFGTAKTEKERNEFTDSLGIIDGNKATSPITKPETTENYHRIPVNPGCEITATITISASQGIKATYCGKVKKIHTYLFDVKKWTMAEAQAWVKEHKDFEPCEEEMNMEEEKQEKFECECIKCGYKMTTDKHCKDIKCPECGGEMRRVERPGPGRDVSEIESKENAPDHNLQAAIKELTDQIAELKEGRVLNAKNRTLVKETIDVLTTLRERLEELYNATEPPAREEGKEPKEGEFILEKNGKQDSLDDSITSVVEKVFGGDKFGKMINDAVKDAFDVGIKKKLGKVE